MICTNPIITLRSIKKYGGLSRSLAASLYFGEYTFQITIYNIDKLWWIYMKIPLHEFDIFKVMQIYGEINEHNIELLLKCQSSHNDMVGWMTMPLSDKKG